MSGETDLNVLITSMSARLVEGRYVFATTPDRRIPAGLTPRMAFQEAEGLSLILREEEAQAADLDYAFPSRMITLEVHSSLEAVGFIARIATELARHGISVNPVSGFYHDHLFVPDGREGEALAALRALAARQG